MDRLPIPTAYISVSYDTRRNMVHVKVPTYPQGADYLQAAVLSEDESRPGWVTMPVKEAEDAGAEIVDHVIGAHDLTFRIPEGYNIGADGGFNVRFRFVSDTNARPPSPWYGEVFNPAAPLP